MQTLIVVFFLFSLNFWIGLPAHGSHQHATTITSPHLPWGRLPGRRGKHELAKDRNDSAARRTSRMLRLYIHQGMYIHSGHMASNTLSSTNLRKRKVSGTHQPGTIRVRTRTLSRNPVHTVSASSGTKHEQGDYRSHGCGRP